MTDQKHFNERYAEKWFTENGYSFSVKKRFRSKTVYIISKDGKETEFALPNNIKGTKQYLEMVKPLIDTRLNGG